MATHTTAVDHIPIQPNAAQMKNALAEGWEFQTEEEDPIFTRELNDIGLQIGYYTKKGFVKI